MTASRSKELGFSFSPVPRRLRVARRARRLSANEYDLLAFLYDRANTDALKEGQETPRLTADQIVEGVPGTGEWATIYKRLQRVRDAPEKWLIWRVRGDRWRGFEYVFTLLPAPPERCEQCPSASEDASPTRPFPETQAGNGFAPDAGGQAVRATEGARAAEPSELRGDLSELDRAADPHGTRFRVAVGHEAVRATQTPGERAKACSEGKAVGPESLEGTSDHDVGETRRAGGDDCEQESDFWFVGTLAEQGVQLLNDVPEPITIVFELADERAADDLAAVLERELGATPAQPLPPLCRYPAHRDAGRDRLGHGGERLLCGICRPPPRGGGGSP